MIEFPRDPQNSIPTSSVKIVGLGGAGANMLDRVALDGLEGAELLALNTDIRTLSGSVAGEQIQLGRNLTKGLGTGGDPELGNKAVQEAEDEIRASIKGRKIVFICVGLGGGTGSGAAPIVARVAREEGAFVVMFATMPFVFEGMRRREQAETALNELAVLSNALVTFDNGRMGELVLAKQGIHEAFAAADRMISESIKAVVRLVVRPGLINVGLDDLMTALRTTRSRCLFGSGISRGKDRAQKALRNALDSPLLDKGALLEDAQSVLVHLCGGEDLTLFEIELLMESLSKHVPAKAHVLFGAAVDPTMEDQLSITLVSSLPEERLRALPTEDKDRAKEERSLEPSMGFAAPTEPKVEAKVEPEPEPEPEWVQEPIEILAPDPEPEPEPEVDSKEEEIASDSKESEPVPEPEVEAEPEPEPKAAETSEPEEAAFFAEPEEGSDEDLEPEPEPEDDDEIPFAEPGPEPVKTGKQSGKSSSSTADDDLFGGDVGGGKAQSELSLDGGPKGRFEGADPSMIDGEDLDVPAFLRKKRH
ncbi:cell division protein FtsZ [Haloferula rosea]|uniref:Cell division protein FtsZ n=1 Tax=Haloferula rosea TaxID=490093 RepID=A0A934VE11_9BACT|nr:cell division protein FtsZ [Haloferula rosea]MBK1825482.1 cell division FtsZ family protein [Haloferula rosea]